MKKGFTLIELATVVGIAAASISLGANYLSSTTTEQQAKNLAREIYEYNGAVGRHIRYTDKAILDTQIGVHEGTSWISKMPASLLSGGQTSNFDIVPTTTIFKENGGLFTTKTVWSPVIHKSGFNEVLMGKVALYASSMVINDTNFNRSAQGATVYCPSDKIELLKEDVREICRANPGTMVSMNFGVPSPILKVQIEALSIDHENAMKAPIVFGNSSYLPMGANKVPFSEMLIGEMNCSGGYCNATGENGEYHGYDTVSDYYSVSGSSGNYERNGNSIQYTKNNGDIIIYNRATRDLTFESSLLCDGAPDPEPTSIPFSEEDITKFSDIYGDGSEYEYIDSNGGFHYYSSVWNEYSYYHDDGSYYYRSDWGTNYDDGVGGSYYVDDLGNFSYNYTPLDPTSCQVSYNDVDLEYGVGESSEWNRIENVARVSGGVLKLGQGIGGSITLAHEYAFNSYEQARKNSDMGINNPWSENLLSTSTDDVLYPLTYDEDSGSFLLPEVLVHDDLAINGDMKVGGAMAIEGSTVVSEAISMNIIVKDDDLDLRRSTGSYYQDDENPYIKNLVLLNGLSARVSEERHNNITLEDGDIDVDYRVNVEGNATATHINATLDPSILAEKEASDPEMGSYFYNANDLGVGEDGRENHGYRYIGEVNDIEGINTKLITDSLTSRDLQTTSIDFSFIEFDGVAGSAAPMMECNYFEVGKYENGDIAVCDVHSHSNKGLWRRLSSGPSLWESNSNAMYSFERDMVAKSFEDFKSYCQANLGPDYYPAFESSSITILKGLYSYKVNGVYKYYVGPHFSSTPRCVKSITH